MHHGSQFEVVIPLSTPRPPPPRITASPRAIAPTAAELAAAQGANRQGPRTDGVYGSDPTCDRKRGWTRRFIRFTPDGRLQHVEGNVTPTEASRWSGVDVTWILPQGTYQVSGRRISGTVFDEPEQDRDASTRSWRLDGIVEGDTLRANIAWPGSPAIPTLLRFTPLKLESPNPQAE
jgi:hypothetical protein